MQGFMQLLPGEYFTDPFKNESTVIDGLFASAFTGVALDAPALVELDLRTTVPILALRVWPNREKPQLDFEQTAILTAVDLRSNFVHVGTAFDLGGRGRGQPPDPPTSDAEELPEGMNAQPYDIDARKRLGLPWERSLLLVTIFARDQQTNRVRVTLDQSQASYRDPEVERFLEERRKLEPPWPIAPHPVRGTPLPSYEKQPASPPVPESHGVALVAPRLVSQDPTATVIVHGSFRLPLEAGRRVRVEHHAIYPHGAPAAVAPITLVVTGSIVAVPFVFRLVCPAAIVPRSDGEDLVGHFALDLQLLGNLKRLAQTNFLYAFAGETMSGPTAIAIVAETKRPR